MTLFCLPSLTVKVADGATPATWEGELLVIAVTEDQDMSNLGVLHASPYTFYGTQQRCNVVWHLWGLDIG